MKAFYFLCSLFREKRGDFVTAALVLPLFLFVLYGGIVGALAWNAKQVLTEAAREGARLAAVGRPDAEVRDRVAAVVNAHMLGSESVPSTGVTPVIQYDLWGLLVENAGRFYVFGTEVRGADGGVQSTLQGLVGRDVGLFGNMREDFTPQGSQNATLVPGSGDASPVVQTGGALMLQVGSHYANIWSGEWAPYGEKIKRVRMKGKSERYFDYGYVYGWNGSSWVELARRCSPYYYQEYDEWIDVSDKNVTRLKTRLTTNGSVLYTPTYVDVPEVEIEVGADTYAVTYQLPVHLPQRIATGGTFEVNVTVTNNCSFTWPAGSLVGLSYHWYNGSNCVVWDGARSYVATPVPPGSSYSFRLTVQTDGLSPGTYRLVVDLVRENMAWFAKCGAPYLAADVEVCQPEYFSATYAEGYREQSVVTNVTTFDKNTDVIICNPDPSDPSKVSVEVRYHVPAFFPIVKLTRAFQPDPKTKQPPLTGAYRGPEILVKSAVKMYKEPI